MCFPLLANKTELYDRSVRSCKFLLQRDRTEEITHSPNIYGAVTWIEAGWNNLGLAPTRQRPSTAEAQLSKSSRGGSWTWRQPSAGEVTRSPVLVQRRTNSAESSRGSVSDSRRPPVKVECPYSYGWKDIWLTKSWFLYNLSFLVSFKHPVNRWAAVGAIEGLWQRLLSSWFPSGPNPKD